MTHKPVNPYMRKMGWVTVTKIEPSTESSEIIPDHLWQSCEPTPELIKQLKPNHIVDCRWFGDDGVKLPEDMTKISSTADAVTTLVRSGHRVLIHCKAGVNRSSLLTCLVLLRLNPNWSGLQAIKYLESKRPGVLTSPVFRKYLTNLRSITESEIHH
jgi:protein-tyrosine phosphatase